MDLVGLIGSGWSLLEPVVSCSSWVEPTGAWWIQFELVVAIWTQWVPLEGLEPLDLVVAGLSQLELVQAG